MTSIEIASNVIRAKCGNNSEVCHDDDSSSIQRCLKSASSVNSELVKIRKCSVLLERCDKRVSSNTGLPIKYEIIADKSISSIRTELPEHLNQQPQTLLKNPTISEKMGLKGNEKRNSSNVLMLNDSPKSQENKGRIKVKNFAKIGSNPLHVPCWSKNRCAPVRILPKVENTEENDVQITEVLSLDSRNVAPAVAYRKSNSKTRSAKNTIVVNSTEQLFQIANGKGVKRKKEPTLVIIDTKSILSGNGPLPISQIPTFNLPSKPLVPGFSMSLAIDSSDTLSDHCLQGPNCNSINETQTYKCSQLAQFSANDIYLIEAPSFVVPYLYSKPSKESFKKFIQMLQKNLTKESYNTVVKYNESEAAGYKDKIMEDNDGSSSKNVIRTTSELIDTSNIKDGKELEVKVREDNISVNINSSKLHAEEHKTKHESEEREYVLEKRITCDTSSGKTEESYFRSPLGIFFIETGLNLVKQYLQTELINSPEEMNTTELNEKYPSKNICNFSMDDSNHNPFHFILKKCTYCDFQTESTLVMADHMTAPHENLKMYKCNFCYMIIENYTKIVHHMRLMHNIRINVESAPVRQQCPNCHFEDNNKSKLKSHKISCAKKHKPERNQEPPLDWEPPAKIKRIFNLPRSKHGKGITSYQGATKPVHRILPKLSPNSVITSTRASKDKPDSLSFNPMHLTTIKQNFTKIVCQRPNISITPLPRNQNSVQTEGKTKSQETQLINITQKLNICEICDVSFSNSGDLQSHLQSIHQAKFSKRVVYSTPSLRCQKCPLRFFTDQGLERHLLGTHSLVTASIQEAARCRKDGGHCPLCAKMFQWKLLDHIEKEHKVILKPVNISYKCTLCSSASFGKYRQFEDHVFSEHGMTKVKRNAVTSQKLQTKNVLKTLETSNEITVISSDQTNQLKERNDITIITLEDQDEKKIKKGNPKYVGKSQNVGVTVSEVTLNENKILDTNGKHLIEESDILKEDTSTNHFDKEEESTISSNIKRIGFKMNMGSSDSKGKEDCSEKSKIDETACFNKKT